MPGKRGTSAQESAAATAGLLHDLGMLHIGAEVPISVDSFPGRSFKGVVEHINTVGEYSPRNLQTADERADQVFAARVGVREGIDQLRAGMAAFITVPK